jgi:hypothetical protein
VDAMNNILILIAQARYLGVKHTFLTGQHYFVEAGSAKAASDAIDQFKAALEKEKVEIVDMLAYVITKDEMDEAAK